MDPFMTTATDSLHQTGSPSLAFAKSGIRPAMPAEAHLDMPEQSLRRAGAQRAPTSARFQGAAWLARLLIFGGGLLVTYYGTMEMYGVVSVGGTTPLEWALLVLFVANFSWIALAFTSGLYGFVWMLFLAPKTPALPAALTAKTAVVMPIYNETPARVFAAVQAMYEDVQATGLGAAFEFFFLSDTTNPDVFVAEEDCFVRLRESLGADAPIYYRHRPKNTARKAGSPSVARMSNHAIQCSPPTSLPSARAASIAVPPLRTLRRKCSKLLVWNLR